MPVLINSETGLAEDLPQDLADRAIATKTHQLPLNDPEGNPVIAAHDQAGELLSQGYAQPSADQLKRLLDHSKYGSTSEQLKTALEGAASAATFGLSTGAEKALGVDPEAIRTRREVNPNIHTAGEIAGLVGSTLIPGVGAANLLTKSGRAAEAALGLGAEGAGLLSRAGSAATRFGVESAIMQSGDEVSKFLSEDPNQSAETAIANVGLGALLGAGIGAPFGAASSLWKAANETKLGKFIEDFKGQINKRLENPEPVTALKNELDNYYKTVTSAADDVYGANGLKSQEIQKVMPEMSDKITTQAQSSVDLLDNAIKSMEKKPNSFPERLTNKLRGDLDQLKVQLSEAKSPGEIFNALQEVKQNLQGYSKFDKFVKPVDEAYDFVREAKNLGKSFREALEETEVWGKAAERQKAINSAFKEFLPTLQDFEKKFTTELNGERVIDPTKINTYFNQIGKPNAEIKQQMLQNFVDAAEKYKKVIGDTHANLGIENPISETPMAHIKDTLEEVSSGKRVADTLINKGLAKIAGGGIGATIGAMIGHPLGGGAAGAIIGEHALGPAISSVLPAIFKPLISRPASAEGLKAAVELGAAAAKGESVLSKAAKAVFSKDLEVLPVKLMPQDAKRDKIKDKLQELELNPDRLFSVGGSSGHYMPDHGSAIAQTALRASQYLNSIKPREEKLGPLDPPRKPSQVEVAKYNRALDIAEQPLVALKSIKEGTLTPEDVKTFKIIYPALYAGVAQKLTNEMINHVSKDQLVPYKTRLSLSLFLGQNLDSTMTPQAIMSAQPKQSAPMNSQQQMPMQSHKGSMNSLNKLSGMYQTPGQARAVEKASRS
jgi:hypothetical protein